MKYQVLSIKYQVSSIKLILIFSLFTFHFSLYSQKEPINTKYFDPQPQNFMQQLKTLFKENQNEELDILYGNLEKEFKGNKISENQLNKMVDILNIMYARKMQVHPYYKNFILAATGASKSGYDEEFQDRWYVFLKGVLETAKKGSNKDFNIFIDFSSDLFTTNALVSDKSKNYIISTKDLDFAYLDKKIMVRVPLCDLKGYFRNDTTTIYKTKGYYSIMEKIWYGNSGKINWTRVGMTDQDVSATFGKYIIDMSKSEHIIDSALLTYPEYFSIPVYGTLTDKITKEGDFTTIMYPQFTAYKKDFSFDKKVSPNVKVNGGFTMKGNDIVINSEEGKFARVEIYDKTLTKRLISAEAPTCLFKKGNYVKMDRARLRIYLGSDSIVHPYSSFKYIVETNQIDVLKEGTGSGSARFKSSFHKMSFDAEMLTWKLDEDYMKLSMLVGQGKNAAKFISDNNFDRQTYNQARGASADMDPLNVLMKMSNDGTQLVTLDQYVSSFGSSFSTSGVMPTIFALERDGFLDYDGVDKTIRLNREQVNFYLKANLKKIDYDLVRFASYGNKFVAKLNINTKKIEVNTVKKIPFNDSSQVYAYPYSQTLVDIGDQRKLKFNGKILAGRLDFYGNDIKFNYDSFTMRSDSFDRVKINVPEKLDKATGEEVLQPLKSMLEKVKGEIQINAKFNKSGKESARNYPKMTTSANSYVYYDNPNIFRGIYNREKFYFEVFPFKKDSIQYFEPENLFYDGKLISANIFEPFNEKLKIQKDLSLGFTTATPASGYSNYKGKGKFEGKIRLNNSGIIGMGDQTYMTTTLSSDSIHYFPEHAKLFAQKMETKEQKSGVEFPQISGDSILAEWNPYGDSMLMVSTKGNPFDMFNKTTRMHGLLLLESKGMTGNGFLDFDEAKISSKLMKFKASTMSADTSTMEIKNLGNKITFKTPNVKCLMNFETKIGDFKSNSKDISTDFAYNQYKAEINEFRWDMQKKILTFKAAEGTKGSKFTSTHPLQDSLRFYPKLAEYNMITSVIKAEGVEEILIADSRVIPDNGKVNILPEAKMETLKNATIEGDTLHYWHTIDKATLDIHGKNDMIGYGEYNLKVNNQNYPIKLNSVRVIRQISPESKKNKPLYNYTIEGTGAVDKKENLKLYRNVDFQGLVKIYMNRKYPHFDGKQRIEFVNPSYKTPWFGINNEINVSEYAMHKKDLVSEAGDTLYTGFMVDREAGKGLYTSIMAKKRYDLDVQGFDGNGVIKHDTGTNNYVFGDSLRNMGNASKGNRMEYNDNTGMIQAEGKINPMLKMNGIPLMMTGSVQNNLMDSSYKFNGSVGMNLMFDPRIMNALSNFLISEFSTNKDLLYTRKDLKNSINELIHERDMIQFNKEIEASGAIQSNPKYTTWNTIFSDLAMEYDHADRVFRSKPELAVTMFAGRPIGKVSQGFFEFGYGEIFDYFNFYIKSKSREWLFITYSDGILNIMTSNELVNGSITSIEPRKRVIKKSQLEYYSYGLTGQYEVDAFVKRMAKGGKYGEEDKRVDPTGEKISEKDIKNTEITDEKSVDLENLEKELEGVDSTKAAEIRALEEELRKQEAMLEELKKASEGKPVDLEEAKSESPISQDIPKPKETPVNPTPLVEQPPAETPPAPVEGEEALGKRETPEETPEEKKAVEPPKVEESESLFDTLMK